MMRLSSKQACVTSAPILKERTYWFFGRALDDVTSDFIALCWDASSMGIAIFKQPPKDLYCFVESWLFSPCFGQPAVSGGGPGKCSLCYASSPCNQLPARKTVGSCSHMSMLQMKQTTTVLMFLHCETGHDNPHVSVDA